MVVRGCSCWGAYPLCVSEESWEGRIDHVEPYVLSNLISSKMFKERNTCY